MGPAVMKVLGRHHEDAWSRSWQGWTEEQEEGVTDDCALHTLAECIQALTLFELGDPPGLTHLARADPDLTSHQGCTSPRIQLHLENSILLVTTMHAQL